MRIFFACRSYIPNPNRPVHYPLLEQVRNGPNGTFAARWSGTDVQRSVPFFFGVADVNDAQLAEIEARTDIHTIRETEWTNRFSTLVAARRNRFNTFCTAAGIEGPIATEVLRDIWSRVTSNIDNKLIEDLLKEMAGDI